MKPPAAPASPDREDESAASTEGREKTMSAGKDTRRNAIEVAYRTSTPELASSLTGLLEDFAARLSCRLSLSCIQKEETLALQGEGTEEGRGGREGKVTPAAGQRRNFFLPEVEGSGCGKGRGSDDGDVKRNEAEERSWDDEGDGEVEGGGEGGGIGLSTSTAASPLHSSSEEEPSEPISDCLSVACGQSRPLMGLSVFFLHSSTRGWISHVFDVFRLSSVCSVLKQMVDSVESDLDSMLRTLSADHRDLLLRKVLETDSDVFLSRLLQRCGVDFQESVNVVRHDDTIAWGSLLGFALECNSAGSAQILLEAGASVLANDWEGWAPLHIAAAWCSDKMLLAQIFRKAGSSIDVQTCGKCRRSALNVAASFGNLAATEALRDLGADLKLPWRRRECPPGESSRWVHETALVSAARRGSDALCSVLLEGGVAVDAPQLPSGRTPLAMVADLCSGDAHLSAALLFLKKGADVSKKDSNGLTPLHLCLVLAFECRKVMARLLLSWGAAVNAADNEGRTVLHQREVLADTALVRELLESWGANPQVEDCRGRTPLQVAVDEGLVDPRASEMDSVKGFELFELLSAEPERALKLKG